MKNQDPIDETLTAKVLSIDDDSHQVVLYSHTSRGEVCVNSKLIYQGHALDSGSHSFVRGNIRNTPRNHKTKNLLSNSRNVSTIILQKLNNNMFPYCKLLMLLYRNL